MKKFKARVTITMVVDVEQYAENAEEAGEIIYNNAGAGIYNDMKNRDMDVSVEGVEMISNDDDYFE